MSTVRDHLWLWCHEAGSHNQGYGHTFDSRMTPVEGAFYLGIPNVIMVVYNNLPKPPFDHYLVGMRPLRRVVWSIVGDASSRRNNEKHDLDELLPLVSRFPNLSGAMMDDFFHNEVAPGQPQARYSPEAVAEFQRRLHGAPRPLDLWVVVYDGLLERPLQPHLDHCDIMTFWTWRAEALPKLEENFARFERLAPEKRKVLGLYLFDYGAGREMPLDLMQHQCRLALEWLRAGRIEGMIFLASCVADLEFPAVEWTRAWIRQVGDEVLKP